MRVSLLHRLSLSQIFALFCAGFFAIGTEGATISSRAECINQLLTKSTRKISDSDPWYPVINLALYPVLQEGERVGFIRSFRITKKGLEMESPVGRYQIAFSSQAQKSYPSIGMPDVQVREDGTIEGQLVISHTLAKKNLKRVRGLIRSLFRADDYFHPHRRPATWNRSRPNVLSQPQVMAVSSLIQMEYSNNGYRRGLSASMGFGKTDVAAAYVQHLSLFLKQAHDPLWQKPPKFLFVVENRYALSQAEKSFTSRLGLKQHEIARYYSNALGRKMTEQTRAVFVTRSSYFSHADLLHQKLLEDPSQPWFLIQDEAHHVGRLGGQFEAINSSLAKVISQNQLGLRLRELLLSGTLWHRDQSIVGDYLNGQVYGPFLNGEELRILAQGKNLPELARAQYVRGVQEGYLPPLQSIEIVTEVSGERVWKRLSDAFRHQDGSQTRVVKVDYDLARDIAKRIINGRRENLSDRGAICFPSIAHANAYAPVLSELLDAEVRPFHSGEETEKGSLDWIRDRAPYHRQKKQHKYFLYVDMLGEAIDIPDLNLMVLVRDYSNTMAGFRRYFQGAGRLFRPGPSKRLIDYTKGSLWLIEGIDQVLVDAPAPSGGPASNYYILVNSESLTPAQFRARRGSFFPEELDFPDRFPFFSLQRFHTELVPLLRTEAGFYGLNLGYSTNWGPKNFILALTDRMKNVFPEITEELEGLRSEFEQNSEWNWSRDQGSHMQKGDIVACRLSFRALHALMALYQMTPQGRQLDLTQMMNPDVVEAFFETLLPGMRGRITDVNALKLFLDPEKGTVIQMRKMVAERGETLQIRDEEYEKNAKGLCIKLAQKLPASPHKNSLIELMSSSALWGWQQGDGLHCVYRRYTDQDRMRFVVLGSNRVGGYARFYRALHAIAFLAEQEGLISPSTVESIHEPDSVRTLLDALLAPPKASQSLSSDEVAKYKSLYATTGGVFTRKFPAFGGPPHYERDGLKGKTLAMAKHLKPGPERTALLKKLSSADFGWKVWDGTKVQSGKSAAIELHLSALSAIAEVLNIQQRQRHPDAETVDVANLLEREEMAKFLDLLLLGYSIPVMTKAQAAQIQGHGGLYDQLFEAAGSIKLPRFYSTNYGPKRLCLKAVATLRKEYPDSDDLRRLHSQLNSNSVWGWSAHEGSSGKKAWSPTERLFRAWYAIGLAWNSAAGSEQVNLAHLLSEDESRKILALLDRHKQAAPVEESTATLAEEFDLQHLGFVVREMDSDVFERFQQADGLLREFARLGDSLGVPQYYSTHYGPRWLATECLKRLEEQFDRSPFLEKALRAVRSNQTWGWRAYDGSASIHSRSRPATERIYRAFYVVGHVWNTLAGRKKVNLDELGSPETTEKFLRLLRD